MSNEDPAPHRSFCTSFNSHSHWPALAIGANGFAQKVVQLEKRRGLKSLSE
jgi:hypothetical protein